MRNLSVYLLLAVPFMLVSCGKAPSSSEIAGKWKCATLNRTIEFRQDGTLTTEDMYMIQGGTYKLSGKHLEIQFETLPEPTRWKISLSGDNLIVVMGAGRQTEAFSFQRIE